MKRLICIIDTQLDFMMSDGKLPVPGAEDIIVPGIRYLSNLGPEDTLGVLFTFDTHDPDIYPDSPEGQQFPIHCVKYTSGWQNVFNAFTVPEVIPIFILEKSVFDMWEEPTLMLEAIDNTIPRETYDRDLFFAQLKKTYGENLIISVSGVALGVCVDQAVRGLLKRGFNVEVIANLTKGLPLGNGDADLNAYVRYANTPNVTVVDV